MLSDRFQHRAEIILVRELATAFGIALLGLEEAFVSEAFNEPPGLTVLEAHPFGDGRKAGIGVAQAPPEVPDRDRNIISLLVMPSSA